MILDATADSLERAAVQNLAEARALLATLHQPGQRDRYRQLLQRAIDAAGSVAPTPRALSALMRAHAARAQDALHGANQLSLSAQRAPTPEACDDGWRRVEAIVAVAEESARAATRIDEHAKAARAARAAAESARKLVDERNHAYTFHTDDRFSFGEGWYLAAAAVLAGVAIQIEPGTSGTARAERFLNDAGLSHLLQPHRSRPRANKSTTSIVAREFRKDPLAAQRKLRAAFLGDEPIAQSVIDWIDPRLAGRRDGDHKKVLVWIRDGAHHANRNTTYAELVELTTRVQREGLVPILIGDALREGSVPEGAVDMILFWKNPIFRAVTGRRAQLQFFEHLRRAHGVVGQLGVTTAGMDGPALLGMPTIYLTEESNVRMREWTSAVPGYCEVVRDSDYLERVSRMLQAWASPTR